MNEKITRRDIMKRFSVGAMAAIGSQFLPFTDQETYAKNANQKRPNILFIFADDWGWGDLSCHGNKWLSTPNLDKFAKQGTEFYQFNVNNPVCSPSRTAVMTGHFPARHSIHRHFAGVEHNRQCGMPDWLDPKAPLVSRIFKQAGYVTGHFGKWHLTNRDVSDAPLPTAYGYDEYGVFNCSGEQIESDQACQKAIDFITHHKDESFFVNLWIHETHVPHYPSAESLKRFADLDPQKQVYAAVVADADKRIGQVLDALDKLALAENTLVIFSSDNGPEKTGNVKTKKADDSTGQGYGTYYSVGTTGGLRGRKRSLYEGGVRVPFIVRWPGKTPAGKIDKSTVITAVDLLPTFCAAAGIALPADYQPDGLNMIDAFKGKQIVRDKPIFWQWTMPSSGYLWPGLAVRDGQWKLLMTFDKKRVELYNVSSDREESIDVADKNPEIVKKLMGMAEQWKAQLPKKPPVECFSKLRSKK